MDGWIVLDRLKRHPSTRHIPVHIVSGVEEAQPALMAGAAAVVKKPGFDRGSPGRLRRDRVVHRPRRPQAARRRRRRAQRAAIIELVGGDGDVEIVAVGSSEEALAALDSGPPFDCMVLDLKLPKMTGFDLLEKVKTSDSSHGLPVIVYTGKELTRREETKLKRLRGDDRRQGRPLAGAAARRDVALPPPASSRSCPSRSARCSSSSTTPTRFSSARRS